jgi:peptidoglycan-associated lipoprotein
MNLRRWLSCISLLLLVVSFEACAKKTPPPPPPPPAPPAAPAPPPPAPKPVPPPPAPPPAPKPVPPPPPPPPPPPQETLEQLTERLGPDVMFDFDSYTLGDSQRSQLQTKAQFLRDRSSLRATIEGHADARGTNEYNLSLGQKRADAVKEYLVSLGIQADRLSTLSKGEEQQVCSEQNEGCWSRNRRGHFIVTAR